MLRLYICIYTQVKHGCLHSERPCCGPVESLVVWDLLAAQPPRRPAASRREDSLLLSSNIAPTVVNIEPRITGMGPLQYADERALIATDDLRASRRPSSRREHRRSSCARSSALPRCKNHGSAGTAQPARRRSALQHPAKRRQLRRGTAQPARGARR